jgi:hypothetical protein
MLQLRNNPILNPPPPTAAVHAKSTNPTIHAPRHVGQAFNLASKTLLNLENAARLIETLPAAGQCLHVICNGNFAAWDIVPAILKLTGDAIRRLDIATLGFSKPNVSDMRAMLDAGQVAELWLVYSCYFRSTSKVETEYLNEQLGPLPAAHLAAFRNHAKLLIVETARGECYTIETSANLRSCKNIEQYAITNDRPLLEFHRAWIEGAIREVAANGEKK